MMEGIAMPAKTLLSLFFLSCALSGAAAAANVEIEFVKPESFSDAGRSYVPRERDDNLEMLKRHIVKQAASRLADDQTLAVRVTDVDLAGDFPRRGANDIRVVRDIYPPRIDLDFRLTGADGKVVKEGKRNLRDNAFMMSTTRYLNDELRFEKALIDDWLDDDFGRPRKK
jgi:DUF3016 family protein